MTWVEGEVGETFDKDPFQKGETVSKLPSNPVPNPPRMVIPSVPRRSPEKKTKIAVPIQSLFTPFSTPDKKVTKSLHFLHTTSRSDDLPPDAPMLVRETRSWGPEEIIGFSCLGVLMLVLVSLCSAYVFRW